MKDTAPTAQEQRQDDWLSEAARRAHVAVGLSRLSDGAFVEVNDAFCRLFGWDRDAILGRSSAELAMWPDPERRERMLELLRRQGSVSGYEARYRNRAGEIGDLLVSATIIERGGQPHLVGFLTEVTDRRELLEGLRAAQGRLAVALQASGLLVFRQDGELRYTWVANPALGITEADVLGRTDDELLGPEAAAPLTTIKRRVLATGHAERRDVWVANNGQLGCFDLVVEPETDASGRISGLVCAAMDITQRMTVHRERTDADDRTAPARAIEGMTSLIGREGLSPRQVQRLRRIEQEVRRLVNPAAAAGAQLRRRLRSRHAGTLVLVAEQNPVLREMTTALLEAAGLRVAQAASGVEAFSRAVQLSPALLLLDMEMPQRGAVAAARALRTTVQRPLPIVAMVSPAPHAGHADALDADLDDAIDKPVTADGLYQKVLAWLESR